MQFAVGKTLYTLHPDDFGYASADNGFILGGIQSRGDLDFDIFGDVFLKCVYVVCTYGNISFNPICRSDFAFHSQSGREDRWFGTERCLGHNRILPVSSDVSQSCLEATPFDDPLLSSHTLIALHFRNYMLSVCALDNCDCCLLVCHESRLLV